MEEEQAGSSPTLGQVRSLRWKNLAYLWSTIFRVCSLDLLRHLVVIWFWSFYSSSAVGHLWDVFGDQEGLSGLGSGKIKTTREKVFQPCPWLQTGGLHDDQLMDRLKGWLWGIPSPNCYHIVPGRGHRDVSKLQQRAYTQEPLLPSL